MSDVLRCIAVDDEPPALRVIEHYAAANPLLSLVQTFDDAISASEFLRTTEIDLIFSDINMPDIDGLSLVRSLPNRPMVIFTTAHKKFAFEGFELDAVDYLLKPIDKSRFDKAVKKAVDFHTRKSLPAEHAAITVRSEYKLLRIMYSDIEYIEGLTDYIKINQRSDKPLLTLMTMKGIAEALPDKIFARIHRSYIVNLSFVKAMHGRTVVLQSGTELPVSETYLEEVRSRLK